MHTANIGTLTVEYLLTLSITPESVEFSPSVFPPCFQTPCTETSLQSLCPGWVWSRGWDFSPSPVPSLGLWFLPREAGTSISQLPRSWVTEALFLVGAISRPETPFSFPCPRVGGSVPGMHGRQRMLRPWFLPQHLL